MRSTDEVHGSLAYDGALLLHVPLCVSRAFHVLTNFLKQYCKILSYCNKNCTVLYSICVMKH